MDDLDYSIDDIGGIEHLDVVLKIGVNVVRGANAAGKTSAIRAIAKAQGADVAARAPRRERARDGPGAGRRARRAEGCDGSG